MKRATINPFLIRFEGLVHDCYIQPGSAKDNMPPLPSSRASLCAVRSVLGGATVIHPDGLLPIHRLAMQNGQTVLAVAGDPIVSYSVCGSHTRIIKCPSPKCEVYFWGTWDWLSSMAPYGHKHLKPTVCFGSALGAQDCHVMTNQIELNL